MKRTRSIKTSPESARATYPPGGPVTPAQHPVMIVDDDEEILGLARTALERNGFQVVTRTTSPRWEDLQRIRPCVVFMDINLGLEDGIDACQAIKQNPRFLALPVILISGMDEERLADAAIECHADGFLSKPYNAQLLVKLAGHYRGSAAQPMAEDLGGVKE